MRFILNKLIRVHFILAVTATIISACNNGKNAKECNQPLNPNGDSELALLMRKMLVQLEKENAFILNQKVAGEYPIEFEKIFTSKASSQNAKGDDFNEFASLYIMSLKHYYEADSLNRVNAFNNTVNSCISCHQSECPGPIKKIEKFLIK